MTQLDLLAPGQICKSGADMGGGFRVILFGGPYTVLHNYLEIVSPKTCFNRLKQGLCIKTYINIFIVWFLRQYETGSSKHNLA